MYNFISLNAKVYSFNYLKEDKFDQLVLSNKKSIIGCFKSGSKNQITYEDYKNVLTTNNQKKEMLQVLDLLDINYIHM